MAISSNEVRAIEPLREAIADHLLDLFVEIPEGPVAHTFSHVWNQSGKDSAYKDGETIFTRTKRSDALKLFGSRVRLTVAEFAADLVFVHAGVVQWKRRAIVIPGH